MPEVLDWQRGDPREALQRAVQELTAGRLVVFPTETGYQVAANALHAGALAALGQLEGADDAVLAVRGVADACRWAPWMSLTARRLGRRCWPGPVTLVVDRASGDQAAQNGPAWADSEGSIRLRAPGHEALLVVLEQLQGPVVLVPAGKSSESGCSAEQVAATLGDSVALILGDSGRLELLSATVVQVNGMAWKVVQEGTVSHDMLQALMPTTILFVCTGNTCRSPMAEVLCKKLLAERLGCGVEELPRRGFLVLSAGMAATMGCEASPEAVEIVRQWGADLSGHRSQPLTGDLLARADHVFTMTQSHMGALLPYCSQEGPQPRLLANDGGDVPDPIGKDEQVYRECAQAILGYLQAALPDIQPL
jgi:L-threonylcarbamoyladenylate synthase